MKVLTTLAVASIVLIASSCQKPFKPSSLIWKYHASNCITGNYGSLESTKKKCSEEETSETVRIYNECKPYLVKSKSGSYYAKADCDKHSDWLVSLQEEVDNTNKELEKERQDNHLKANLEAKIDKCLDAVEGIPMSAFHKNSFGDYRDGPHPLCANVLEKAQSSYMSYKKSRCNDSMERYSEKLRNGDYYSARGSLNSAVEDCN